MATTIGALRVELSANIAKFEAAMGKAAKNMARTQRSFERFGNRASAAGQALSIGLTAPLVAVGVGALRSSMAFESAFAGVIKTVDDATDSMGRLTPVGEALQQGFRDLSLQIPIAATELAGIGEVAGQLGIESENILGFTEVMAKLGVTTNLSAEEAATSLAQLANITSLPQTEFERLGSTVVALGNNLATNEAQIVDFGKRIASAGTIAGLTEPQILAIGGAMASVGVQSEAGGTAVQKVLNAMTKSVAQGGEKLEIFARTAGLSAADFQRAFREDAAGAFASFVTGLGQQGDAAFTTLDGLTLGNERVVRSFLSLAAKSTTLTDALALGTTAWEENTALAREADIRFQTTASQLKLLANQVVEAGRALGDILKPILQTVVGIVREQVVPWLKTVVDRFKALSPEVQQSRILWLGLAAALGPALIVMGGVARVLSPLVPLFGRIWSAAGRMSNALVKALGHPIATAQALRARLVTLRARLVTLRGSLAGLSLSARASAVGVKLASVALTGLRFAIRGVIAALGPMILVFAAFEFAAWAAGALKLGDKLKRLVGITDDAANAADRADQQWAEFSTTLDTTRAALDETAQQIDALTREHERLTEQLARAQTQNRRSIPFFTKRIAALETEIETLQRLHDERAKDVQFGEFLAPLAALAAKDLETWAAASREAKTAARELGVELSVAVKMDHLTRAVHTFAETAALTPIVMREIGTQAAALGVPLEDLPPELKNIVTWLNHTAAAATKTKPPVEDLGSGVGDVTEDVQALIDTWTGASLKSKALVAAFEALSDEQLGNKRLMAQVLSVYESMREVLGPFHAELEQLWQTHERLKTPLESNTALTDRFMEAQIAATRAQAALNERLDAHRRALLNLPTEEAIAAFEELRTVWDTLSESERADATEAYRAALQQAAESGIRLTAKEAALVGQDAGMNWVDGFFGAPIGQTFARALEGGGGFLGAAQSLGVQGGNRLGDALSGGLAKKMTAETGFFSKGIGSFFGKAMGQAIPFIGPLVGLGIGKIFGAFTKPSEAELAARQQVADYQHTIIEGLSSSQLAEAAEAARGEWAGDAQGAQFLTGVRDAYVAAGRSAAEAEVIVKRYWAASKDGGPEAVAAIQAEIDAVVQVGQVQQQRLAELGALKEAGQAAFNPAQIEPYLEKLLETGTLTAQQADALRGLADEAHVDYRAMQSAAEKYGVELSTLGPAFDQARISDAASVIVKDFELLTQEGADVNGVLAGMQDEVQDLVTDALQAGVAIPEGMRPILTSLIEQGRLTDANSEKLTDLSGLTFAEPLAEKFDTLITKLTELIETISGRGGVTEAIEHIPRDVEVGVDLRYREHDRPDGFAGVDVEYARHGTPFRQFGRGTPAMLHGFERVMTGMEGRGITAALARIQQGLGAIADLSGVRALAKGGLVTRPTLTTFAEHGPEVGIPLERLEEFGGGRRVEVKLDQLNQNVLLLIDEFRHGLDPRRTARALVAAVATN